MNKIKDIIIRYLILIVLGLGNLYLFYLVFTPLTVYPSYIVLGLFGEAKLLVDNIILFDGLKISIIPACVAGAAYYLLLVLNLTTPMELKTRIRSIFFLFGVFLIVNIGRIVLFSELAVRGFQYFDLAHSASWYVGSTLLVVIIWFVNVKLFNIKKIPVYTDIMGLRKELKNR